MKILKCKINTKKTKIKPNINNLPKTLIKEFKKLNIKNERSLFYDYAKAKKSIYIFALDEKNKTIASLDQNPPAWHGIFKKEKLEYKQKYSSKKENIYSCVTSHFYGIGGFYATVLYNYLVTVSSAKSGLLITCTVRIAHPHKTGKEPNFKLCDAYEIAMDCIENKNEEVTLSTGIDEKNMKKLMNKNEMNKAISLLKSKPKKSNKMFSRRIQQYDEILKYNRYDLTKIAKCLHELAYEFLNDTGYSYRIFFKNYLVQFYILYSIHFKIDVTKALLEVLKILNISKDNKLFEGMTFPVSKK